MNKIAIFCRNLEYPARKYIYDIVEAFPAIQFLILYPSHLQAHKHLSCADKRASQDITTRNDRPYPGKLYEWDSIQRLPNLSHADFKDWHQDEIAHSISLFKPDLGLLLSTEIPGSPYYDIPTLGTIRLQVGKPSQYRDIPTGFWELYHGEQNLHCTIHKINKDCFFGDILLDSSIPISRYSTTMSLHLLADEAGISLFKKAIRLLNTKQASWKPSNYIEPGMPKPSRTQLKELEKRTKTPIKTGLLKHLFKEAVFLTYAYLLRPIPRLILAAKNKQRIVVVNYHRINDDLRDSLTVGIEQFDRQMAIVKSDYTVVSVEDILTGNIPRNTSHPVIAITFDDGYIDNYIHAVPILLKYQIPVSFFISTGIVGTSNGFQHDIDKLGEELPSMTWEHVQHMHDLGFTIGSHTVSHINVAKGDPEEVRKEIVESKETLIRELGINKVVFAYPFGKKEDMNQEMRDYIQKVGYLGCLSAYGGVNGSTFNPFNLLRMGIDYGCTDLGFRARLEGFNA